MKSSDALRSIYAHALRFCVKKGLVLQLKKSLAIEERHRFKKLKISKKGLHMLDAVHCLYDKSRTHLFLEEIRQHATKKSIVIEAGFGTGVLAFFAATQARDVYGVEINPATFRLARDIENYLIESKVLNHEPKLLLGDATKIHMPEKADIIVNENIYTGIFFENQVQIMRHMKRFLKKGGIMIPESLHSHVILSETVFPHTPKHRELFVPMHEKNIKSKMLSKASEYDILDFNEKISSGINKTLTMPVTKSGALNSVLIYTDVFMPSGKKVGRNATRFLNNDIILALHPSSTVEKGDIVRLHLSYPYGAKPSKATLKAVIMKST